MRNKTSAPGAKLLPKNLYSRLTLITVTTVITGYAIIYAYTNLPTQTSGNPLTATIWNDVVNKVNDIGTRTDGITSVGGNIGIGTASPVEKLHISSTSQANLRIEGASTSGNGGGVQLIRLGTNAMCATNFDGSFNISHCTSSYPGTSVLYAKYNGNVGIGTTSPTAKLDVHAIGELVNLEHDGGSTSPNYVTFKVGGVQIGSITNNGSWGGISYNTTSDRRLKENFVKVDSSLKDLDKINVYKYNYIADSNKTQQIGFIAQELYKIYPQAVTVGGDNPKVNPRSVDYSKMVPLLTNAIQELKSKNDKLEERIRFLESK